MVFFLTVGSECDSLGIRSERIEMAKGEVMICGRVMRGREAIRGSEELISFQNISTIGSNRGFSL